METLVERLKQLNKEGYTNNLNVKDEKLYYSDKKNIPLKNVSIDKTFRIEDDSDPMNQTVIYALSSKDPYLKGLLINSYGTYSEVGKDRVIGKIQKQPE